MQRSAVVYSINNRLVVGASRRTAAGMQLEVEPREMKSEATAEEIAACLTSALDASTPIVITPSDWKGAFNPFLKAAGVKSLKAFMLAARSVNVDERDGTFVVTPNRNLGLSEGFEPMSNEAFRLADLRSVAHGVLARLRAG